MNSIMSIVRKELRGYFNSAIAYIVVIFFLIFPAVWLFFFNNFFQANTATLRGYFGIMPFIFIALLPALTMRSWAEERKLGTEELLLTLPFKETQIIIGKFLAPLILLLIMLVLTLPLPISLSLLGRFDIGQIIGEYLGILLLGSAGIAIGLFISSLTTNQITAFILSAVILLFITLVGYINNILQLPDWIANLLTYLSLDHHFASFRKGLMDTRDALYFIFVTILFLYLNLKSLILKKWS